MRRALLPLVLLLALPALARAQWSTSIAVDDYACLMNGAQQTHSAVTDGAGGVVSAWSDGRRSGKADVYAQRTDANGYPLWALNGVPVDTTAGSITRLVACEDDSGGTIVVWYRGNGTVPNRLFAQRVDGSGQVRWGSGVRVSTQEVGQSLPSVVSDGQGGAIVIWAHARGGATAANVFGQRLDRNGARQWSDFGDSLAERGEIRSLTAVKRNGGGAFFAFWRTFGVISAAGIDVNGNALWSGWDSLTTVPMSTSPPGLGGTTTTDGAIFWVGDGTKLLARKFGDGGPMWPSSKWVATHAYTKNVPSIVSDDAGGAILSWRDGRPDATFSAWAQRLGADGSPLWSTDGARAGTPIILNGGGQTLVADGQGGAWIATSGYPGAWVQHFSAAGEKWLPEGGVNISSTSNYFGYGLGRVVPGVNHSFTLVASGGTSSATGLNIWMKHWWGDGSLSTTGAGGPSARGALALAAGPNPARERTSLRFTLPRAAHARLEVFGLRGERVATLADEALPAGAHVRTLELGALPPGIYHVRLATEAGTATARIAHVR